MYKVTKDELLLDSLVEHTRKKRNDCKSLLK
ncbi:RluA family pseudouridine synthase, partial [Catenibacterium mitsuokai]|nr:RluA family pseudouridine synthase [Catenibacterium mitsuokai]